MEWDKFVKVFGLALLAAVLVSGRVVLAEEMDDDENMKGSIAVATGTAKTAFVKLAKVTFAQAMNAALTAVPGQVLDGELQNEKGSLVYDFEIVDAKGSLFNVMIDAGSGKVMEADKEGGSNAMEEAK